MKLYLIVVRCCLVMTLALLSLSLRAQTNPLVVSTLAGESGFGSSDGTTATARFFSPSGIAVNSNAFVYVADSSANTIRLVSPLGIVTTVVGAAQLTGTADGTGTNARLQNPEGVALDAAGNVYIADTGNSTIRMLSTNGEVTTIAGVPGVAGFRDGPTITNSSTGAEFNMPAGIAVDASNNIYVADSQNFRIRKIASGMVTTIAGNSVFGSTNLPGTNARFYLPSALVCDISGNIYVADTANDIIRKITSSGIVSTIAGLGGITFHNPMGITLDGAGNLYVGDTSDSVVRKLTPSGTNWTIATLAGELGTAGSADGPYSAGTLNAPWGVGVDGSGNVYVGDYNSGNIRKITSDGSLSTVAGSVDSGSSNDGLGSAVRFNRPYGVAVDLMSNVYVADSSNNSIRYISANGFVQTLAGSGDASGSIDGTNRDARFNLPTGVCVDAASNVYVADFNNSTIRKLTPDAGGTNWVVTTLAGSAGQVGFTNGSRTNARFNHPYSLVLDSGTNLYVADAYNDVIRKITPDGTVTTYADTNLGLSIPLALAIDGNTNLYVVDGGNRVVKTITPMGTISTLTNATPLLTSPQSVAVDATGTVYIGDNNGTIVAAGTNGIAAVVAGTAGILGSADGVGSAAQFDVPSGLAVDAGGTIYVADRFNNSIRKAAALPLAAVVYIVKTSPQGLMVGINGILHSNAPQTIFTGLSGGSFTNVAVTNAGYTFSNWTINGLEVSTNPTFVLDATSNLTLVANYSITNVLANLPVDFLLTGSVYPTDAGTVSGGGSFALGTEAVLTATPAAGFQFIGWAGDGTGTNNPLTVSVNANLNIKAYFAPAGTNILLYVITNGPGKITPYLTGKYLRKGGHYTLTVTPKAGYVFSNWTGSLTTNKNPLALKIESSMVLQANIITNPFTAWHGTYNGLFSTGVVDEQTAGMLRGLTIGPRGTYSGALLVNGSVHGLAGTFTLGGFATNLIRQPAATGKPLFVELNVGTLSNGVPGLSGVVIGTNNNTPFNSVLVADLATNTIPSREFTLLIPPATNAVAPASSPGGFGYAAITNFSATAKTAAAAHVRITGSLADGTPFSQVVPASADGYVPVYANLYAGKGLLMGWLNLTNAAASDVSLTWIHQTRLNGLYPNGFTNYLGAGDFYFSPWTNGINFGDLTNISLFESARSTNILSEFPVTVDSHGRIAGSDVTGTVSPQTGVFHLSLGGKGPHTNSVGVILGDTNFGGGNILTKTQSEAIKIGP